MSPSFTPEEHVLRLLNVGQNTTSVSDGPQSSSSIEWAPAPRPRKNRSNSRRTRKHTPAPVRVENCGRLAWELGMAARDIKPFSSPMKLKFPKQLISKLKSDEATLMEDMKTLSLPRRPTIENILASFRLYMNANPEIDPTLTPVVVDGVLVYFNRYLWPILLYSCEGSSISVSGKNTS
ncbi:hypothetical protein R3P38DRAFT_3227776 [Favolaschia claudopus]|uniref:MRG domain-containing protein n=1 Tax=Favolaschia claudopus TaxID=2862362 RepID=A0AAV9ZS58_9AGAR